MIKYRKGKELLDQVAEDLASYADQGLIDYSRLYKILRRCNADLSEKINPDKDDVITIRNFKGRLPDDFNNLNYAILCNKKTINVTMPSGFHVEYKTLCENTGNKCSPCITDSCGDTVIVQKCDQQFQQFSDFEVVKVNAKSFKHCIANCPNLFSKCFNSIELADNGLVVTNFQEGDLYINYVGAMEDSDEDLLILDHPLVEPYYEAAVTNQILKNMVYNKEADVADLYKDSMRTLGRARIDAVSFVNRSGYKEMLELIQSQRTRLYNKFFSPIL